MKYYVFDNETYGKKFFKGIIDIPDKILANTNKMMQMVRNRFPKLGKNIFISQRKFKPRSPKTRQFSSFVEQKKSGWDVPEIE